MIGFCHVCQDRYRVQRHERQSLDPSAETLHVAESVHWINKQNRLFQNKVNPNKATIHRKTKDNNPDE